MIDSIEKRRPRVLMLAFACSPFRASEPFVGWNRALECAKYCDTWVICEEREFAAEVRAWLEQNGDVPGLKFVFVPMSDNQQKLYKIPGLFWVAYNRWHRRAFQVAEQLHREHNFDLVHQTTFCGYREPGYLWRLNAPFIWGPFGGTQNFPLRFLSVAGFRGALSETVRGWANRLQLRWGRRIHQAARRAKVVMVSNSTNQCDVAGTCGVTPLRLLETGVQETSLSPPKDERSPGPLRILWAGNHQAWKALPLLIDALAQLPEHVRYEVRVTGRGPQTGRWQQLAREAGIDQHIRWLGFLPNAEAVSEQFRWADVLVFTSLRDTSGNVMLDAFAAGAPVICLDHQGAHDMVTDDCGVKIPVTNPRQVSHGIAAAIANLVDNPDRLARLSRGAHERANYYLWPRQGARMAQVYRDVLGDGFVWSDASSEGELVSTHEHAHSRVGT